MKAVGAPLVVDVAPRIARGKDAEVEVGRQLFVLTTYVKPAPGGDESLSCDCSRAVTATHLIVWHSPECPELQNA